ncbi:hypothetical protein Agabi119p4_4795 [Agaricus bisporus var. burnettii]|uniref:Uncharacterized protein n=1 Tax=Agaricus bisporus var. burnettii TaxID=192524 RepID=A0A8H7KHP2_AGABI|nr:hypothetical protein Agabi119p4_4795 [Agaricus bisporus var. burnettii]
MHQPLIRFIGRRKWPSTAGPPHPHPAASPEFRNHFAQFLKKRETVPERETVSASSPHSQFWEAPSRFWKPRVRQLEDAEMDAIMSGGASSYGRH